MHNVVKYLYYSGEWWVWVKMYERPEFDNRLVSMLLTIKRTGTAVNQTVMTIKGYVNYLLPFPFHSISSVSPPFNPSFSSPHPLIQVGSCRVGKHRELMQLPNDFAAFFAKNDTFHDITHTHTLDSTTTRKPSCRWQTRATLAKSSHGLRKSSGGL